MTMDLMTKDQTDDIQAVAKLYFDAWDARDLDAIMALHSSDTIFHSHTGQAPVTGAAAVRAAFADLLQMAPDISFRAWDLRFGEGFWTAQMVVNGTRPQADGPDLEFSSHSVDVIWVEGGRVTRKDSYVDTAELFASLAPPASW